MSVVFIASTVNALSMLHEHGYIHGGPGLYKGSHIEIRTNARQWYFVNHAINPMHETTLEDLPAVLLIADQDAVYNFVAARSKERERNLSSQGTRK